MKILFIGTVELSLQSLKKLISLKADIVGIITQSSPWINADYADLTVIAREENIDVMSVDKINNEHVVQWIKARKPDIIFCFGLSQILPKEILEIPPMGILGYHPALLPQNRGRHPVIWPLVLGLSQTGSTFFFLDEGIDSGPILDQVLVPITAQDNATTLYKKLTAVALTQIERFLSKLESGRFQTIPQDHQKANYLRKRNPVDGCIDFRMSSQAIFNLVRALAKPYPGACIKQDDQEVKIWSVEIRDCFSSNVEYGKVLAIEGTKIVVKTMDSAVVLLDHEFKVLPNVGRYL